MLPILLAIALAAIIAYVFLVKNKKAAPPPAVVESPPPAKKAAPKKVDITKKTGDSASPSSSSSSSQRKSSDAAEGPQGDHPLVYRHLRGHQGEVTGVAVGPNARHVVSVAKDEQLRLWTVVEGEKNTTFARVNMKKGEYASAVAISADDKYVVVAIAETKQIQIFGIKDDKKTNQGFLTPLHSFATPHKANITTVKMASNCQYIVTMAAEGTDLNMYVFSPKGAIISQCNIAQLVNYSFAVSDDARFIATATKISDAKVYEVGSGRKDPKSPTAGVSAPEKVEFAFALKGHKRGIKSINFASAESGLVVSASVDGAFAVHELGKREEPKLRSRIQTEFESLSLIDVHSDGEGSDAAFTIALASAHNLQFWRMGDKNAEPTLVAAVPHAHKGNITALEFAGETEGSNKRMLVTAGENKSITLWNIPQ